jgi:uroporphyrinogen-III synthase
VSGRKPSAQPLRNLGVAVTRPEERGGQLGQRLERLGARVLHWQAVRIEPPADPAPLAGAIAALQRFDWIVFASAHAVAAVRELLPANASDALAKIRVAAVGTATAAAAERAGWRVDRVPADFGAAGLLEGFKISGDARGLVFCCPAARSAGPSSPRALRALGATVKRVEAYRAVPAELDGKGCRAQLAAGEVDAIAFTSPSAVEAVARALGVYQVGAQLHGCCWFRSARRPRGRFASLA